MILDTGVKFNIMQAMRDSVAGGSLEIGTANMKTVLASFKLDESGGSVDGATWRVGIAAPTAEADVGGRAEAAQLKDRTGTPRITGLRVGMRGSNSDVVLSNTQVNKGQHVTIDGDQIIEHL